LLAEQAVVRRVLACGRLIRRVRVAMRVRVQARHAMVMCMRRMAMRKQHVCGQRQAAEKQCKHTQRNAEWARELRERLQQPDRHGISLRVAEAPGVCPIDSIICDNDKAFAIKKQAHFPDPGQDFPAHGKIAET
jgi:hypothetical protein